ncbi:MAG: hypothetical protein WD060_14575, partial [Pirellulales bacterium]
YHAHGRHPHTHRSRSGLLEGIRRNAFQSAAIPDRKALAEVPLTVLSVTTTNGQNLGLPGTYDAVIGDQPVADTRDPSCCSNSRLRMTAARTAP